MVALKAQSKAAKTDITDTVLSEEIKDGNQEAEGKSHQKVMIPLAQLLDMSWFWTQNRLKINLKNSRKGFFIFGRL